MRPETHPERTHSTGAVSHRSSDHASARAAATRGGRAAEPSDAFDPNAQGGFSRVVRTLPLTLALTAAAGVVLVTVATAIAYRAPDPSALTAPLAYSSLGVTSLIGGILSGRRNGEDYLLGGLMAGTSLALLLILISFFGEANKENSPFFPWLARLGVVLLHVLGAYITRPRAHAVSHASVGRAAHSTHRR